MNELATFKTLASNCNKLVEYQNVLVSMSEVLHHNSHFHLFPSAFPPCFLQLCPLRSVLSLSATINFAALFAFHDIDDIDDR